LEPAEGDPRKKWGLLLIAAAAGAMCITAPSMCAAQQPTRQQLELLRNLPDSAHVLYILGDLNGDGVVDQKDLALLREIVAKPSAPLPAAVRCQAAGDVNLDRTLDASDVAVLAGWQLHHYSAASGNGTAGIDPVARRELWDLLFRLAEAGKTFFVTTHYMDEAERCSEVAYIFDGKLIAYGSGDDLRRLPGVEVPGTVRYAVQAHEIMATFTALRALAYVKDATILGREVHVIVDASTTPEKVAGDLHGLTTTEGVKQIDPSLEDVFVALTRERRA